MEECCGSDEGVNVAYPCHPCKEKNKLLEASIGCNSCRQYFCTGCSYPHSRQHPDHRVTSREQVGIRSSIQLTEKCIIHGDLINMYCSQHDEVACASCIATQGKHRYCVPVKHIPTEIGQLFTHINLTKTVESLDQQHENLCISREILLKHKHYLKIDQDIATKAIEERFHQYLIKLYNHEYAAMREVESKGKEIDEQIETQLKKTESILQSFQQAVLPLQTPGINDAQKFVAMKQLQIKAKEAEKLSQEIRDASGSHGIVYTFNSELEECLDKMTSLGTAQTKDQHVYQKVKSMSQVIGEPGDSLSNITSCCVLDDGSVVLVDETNKKLKLLENLILKHSIVLQNKPCSVCASDSNGIHVLVSFSDKSVNVFKIENGSFIFKSGFSLPHDCKNIAFHHGELYIADGKSDVHVYNSLMTFVRSLSSLTGSKFMSPSNILFNADGTILMVVENWRVVGVDRHGKEVFREYYFEETEPRVVCSDGSHGFFQVDPSASSIVQLGPKAVKMGKVMKLSYNQSMPQAMCFNPLTRQLILAFKSNTIQIHNLE